jgi:hypothetical protein
MSSNFISTLMSTEMTLTVQTETETQQRVPEQKTQVRRRGHKRERVSSDVNDENQLECESDEKFQSGIENVVHAIADAEQRIEKAMLHFYYDLPTWRREGNTEIKSGYRPESPSVTLCLKSLGYIHNETSKSCGNGAAFMRLIEISEHLHPRSWLTYIRLSNLPRRLRDQEPLAHCFEIGCNDFLRLLGSL